MKVAVMMRAMDKDSGFRALTDGMTRAMLEADPAIRYLLIYQTPKWFGRYAHYPNAEEVLANVRSPLLWDQVAVPYIAWRRKADVIFNVKFFVPMLGRCPVTMGLQEPAWFTLPEQYEKWDGRYQRLMIPLSIRRCAHLFPNSRFILEENRRVLAMPIEHATVTYSAPEERFAPITDERALSDFRRTHGLPEKFVLLVTRVLHIGVGGADLFPGKSPEVAYRAFARIRAQVPHELVIAGSRVRDYLARTEGPSERFERVRFLDFFPFEQMHLLYNAADMFVNPCAYEGCPNTVLQAMATGRPMVVAAAGGSADVAEGAALMAKPLDPIDMAEKMLSIARDGELARDLSRRSLARAARFTWQRSALDTISALRSVVGRDRRRRSRAASIRSQG